MVAFIWLDLAPGPDPAGVGALLAVVLLVIGCIALLAAGLVLFLWYRKRNLRGVEMIRPEREAISQPSNPNQP